PRRHRFQRGGRRGQYAGSPAGARTLLRDGAGVGDRAGWACDVGLSAGSQPPCRDPREARHARCGGPRGGKAGGRKSYFRAGRNGNAALIPSCNGCFIAKAISVAGVAKSLLTESAKREKSAARESAMI